MISINKAINYPFSQSDWKKKFFIIFIILFVTTAISATLQLIQLPFEMAAESESEISNIAALGNMSISMIGGFVSLITLPFTLYISGYQLKNIKNIVAGKLDLPEHTDIWNTILLGLVRLLISFVYSLPATMIMILSFILFFIELGIKQSDISFSPMVVISIVLFIISILSLIFTGIFLEKSATLEYIKENRISAIFNVIKVFKQSFRHFGKFLQIFFIQLLIAFMTIFVMLFTICIAFISSPFIQTVLIFATAYIEGNIYKEIIDNN